MTASFVPGLTVSGIMYDCGFIFFGTDLLLIFAVIIVVESIINEAPLEVVGKRQKLDLVMEHHVQGILVMKQQLVCHGFYTFHAAVDDIVLSPVFEVDQQNTGIDGRK